MSLPLYIHGLTDVGRQRERNEDTFRVCPRGSGGWLLLVCDGMGGHGGGHIASKWAADFVVDRLPAAPLSQPPQAIREALAEANVVVLERAETSSDPAMGTTAVLAWIEGTHCWCGWVGDSRLYRFREGARLNRTVDHTRVQRLVELKMLSLEEARHHPDAHILTQAIGGGEDRGIRPSVLQQPMELEEGDVLLLCSDGMYDMIEDDEIYPLIDGLHYQEAVERLIAEANARGGADNITVVLCVVGSPTVPRVVRAADGEGAATRSAASPVGVSSSTGGAAPPRRRWGLLLLPLVAVLLVVGMVVVAGLGSAGWHLFQREAPVLPPPPPPLIDLEAEDRALADPPPPPPLPEVPLAEVPLAGEAAAAGEARDTGTP